MHLLALVTRITNGGKVSMKRMKGWDKCWMHWPLGTSLVVAMHDDIENTSVGIDHVLTFIYQSIALQTRARLP